MYGSHLLLPNNHICPQKGHVKIDLFINLFIFEITSRIGKTLYKMHSSNTSVFGDRDEKVVCHIQG
jgi:hypothetical protein